MRLLILALAAAVAGCAQVDQQQIAEGTYRLHVEHTFAVPGEAGRAAMRQEAVRLCPNGYERVRERGGGNDVSGFSEWTVRCD